MVANMATEVEASRFLTYHAAWCYDQGLPYSKEAALVCVESTCHPPVTDPAKLQA